MPSRKLRGFEPGKIGPKDGSDFIGGNYATSLNISTTLPELLKDLENVDFKFFGLSLATINTFISLIFTVITLRIFLNYEKK